LKIYFYSKYLFFLVLISVFSFTIFSCSEKDDYKSFEKYGANIIVSPTIPDNFSASGASNTVTLSWEKVEDAASYTIFWNTEGEVDANDNAITSITNDNYTHSNLENGSRYYYKVAAVSKFFGMSTLSSSVSAIIASNIQASKTFNGHTYALTTSAMTWQEAKEIANTLGGYPTTVNTKTENDWLTTEFFRSPGVWIGANDQDSEGTWIWDNGTTSGDNGLTDDLCGTSSSCTNSDAKWEDNSTEKWCTINPNNGAGVISSSPGQDCGNIWYSSGCWDDLQCSSSLHGILEFD